MATPTIGALKVTLGLNSAQFTDGMKRVNKTVGKIGRSMRGIGRSMSVGVSAPLAAFGGLTLKAAGDFQQGMNRVEAVSGATAKQLGQLSDQAKELGASTQFSASQAADAMGFLAQAGFEADQILGAMPGTLQLAAAAQMDLGETADVVSNILQGYGKDVSELAHVNDVLVKAFTSANTDLKQLGEAMKFAGPVASAAGVQFEEAAAALALMGNAGIQASMAGTSLRGSLSRMLKAATDTGKLGEAARDAGLNFVDAQGRLLPLVDIIRQLEPHAQNAGLFMQLFGERAGPALAALVGQGAASLENLTGELVNAGGTAEAIAAAQMKGFNGAMREMRSAFEAVQIAIAESGLLEFMTEMIRKVAAFLQNLSQTNPELLKWGTVVAAAAVAIGPLLIGLGALLAAISAISLPVAAVVAGITGLAAVWYYWDDLTDIAVSAMKALYHGVKKWAVDKLGAVWDWVASKVQWVGDKFKWLYDRVVGNSYIPDMVTEIGDHMGRLQGEMVRPIQNAMSSAVDAIADGTFKARSFFADLAKDISKMFLKRAIGGLFGGGGFLGGLFGGVNLPMNTLSSIPTFHSGGTFRAPAGAREGLAMLEDGERILPEGTSLGQAVNVSVTNNIDGADAGTLAAIESRIALMETSLIAQVEGIINNARATNPALVR